MRLGPRDDGVPDHIGPGRKALDRIGHAGRDPGVVALDFIAGVAQHHGAPGRGGQKGFQGLKTILTRNGHLPAHAQLLNVARKRLEIGGVQLKQLELVAPAEELLLDEGRARVNFQMGRIAGLGEMGVQAAQQLFAIVLIAACACAVWA